MTETVAEKPKGYKATKWRDATIYRCTTKGCEFDHEYEDVIKQHVTDAHSKKETP